MKSLAEQTHYERLDVAPSATVFEIQHAYKLALEIYGTDSLVTYAFFTEAERQEILRGLEESFRILMKQDSRDAYDRMLIEEGRIDETDTCRDARGTLVPLFLRNSFSTARRRPMEVPKEWRDRAQGSPVIQGILGKDAISGSDIREIREALGITLEQIFQKTKVPMNHLEHIEEDRFSKLPSLTHLKGFLRAYARCLPLSAEDLVEKYTKRLRAPSVREPAPR